MLERQKELKEKLFIAANRAQKSRSERILGSPWKMFYPKANEFTKRSKETKARTFWGAQMDVIIPEPVSTIIWRYGFFEADVCLYMINFLKEEMSFIDIGAHFGFFTLLGSYLVGNKGQVYSFEPMPQTYCQLQKNINNYSNYVNIKTFNCAAYSSNSKLKFHDFGLVNSAYNSRFGAREIGQSGDIKNEIMVECRKVDDVLAESEKKRVGLIKIDAESSEIEVLKGMERTISAHRPKIIVEVGDFAIQGVPESKEIIAWLQDLHYIPYDVRNGSIVRHITRNHYKYGNLLFINKEDNVQ